jgi:hypothetical protein
MLDFFEHAKSLVRARQELADGPLELLRRPAALAHEPVFVVTRRLVQDENGLWDDDESRPSGVRADCSCGWIANTLDDSETLAELRYLRDHLGWEFPSVTGEVVDAVDFTDGQGTCAHDCGFDGRCVACGDEVGF